MMRSRPSWWFLAALALISALCGYLLVGCVHLDPCDLDVAYCLANGGTWVQDEGEPCGGVCVYLEPCAPPAPGPECEGGDPATWCDCWECSGRTDGQWMYTGDCPFDCRTDGECPEGHHCDWTTGACRESQYDEECQAHLDQGAHFCAPAETCSDPEDPCVHNPSADPRHCEIAPACQGPPPDECSPPGPVPHDVTEVTLVPFGDLKGIFHDEIHEATRMLGDRRHCTFRENLDAVAAQLKLQLPDHRVLSGIDATFVERSPGGLYDEYHTVGDTDRGWTAAGRGKFIMTHRAKCSISELPPFARFNQQCPRPHGQYYDCTALFGPDADRCASLGYTDGRQNCVILPDGHPERDACERAAMGGPHLVRCSVGEVAHKNGNRWLSTCVDPIAEWIEYCLHDGTRCRRGVVE